MPDVDAQFSPGALHTGDGDAFAKRIESATASVNAAASELRTLVAQQVCAMATSWNELSRKVNDCQAKRQALRTFADSAAREFQSLRQHDEAAADGARANVPQIAPGDFVRLSSGGWAVSEELSG